MEVSRVIVELSVSVFGVAGLKQAYWNRGRVHGPCWSQKLSLECRQSMLSGPLDRTRVPLLSTSGLTWTIILLVDMFPGTGGFRLNVALKSFEGSDDGFDECCILKHRAFLSRTCSLMP